MENEMMNIGTTETKMFCSMREGTLEERAKVYNAINNPDAKLRDHINETIYVNDVYCEEVMLEDGSIGHRIVMIDKYGVSYSTMSTGVYNSMRNMMKIIGMPPWEELPIKVKQINLKEKQVLTLAIGL